MRMYCIYDEDKKILKKKNFIGQAPTYHKLNYIFLKHQKLDKRKLGLIYSIKKN